MKRKLLIIFILFLPLQWAMGQRLEEYLIEAGQNNPELKAYFHAYLADQEKIDQVGSLPDPTVTFGYFIQPMEYIMGTQRAELSIMQEFPWFGTLANQKNEKAKAAKVKYYAFQEAKNQLYYAVKAVWFQLLSLEEKSRLLQENLELLKTMERLALTRFKGGVSSEGSMTDVLKIQLEIKEVENELAMLGDDRFPLEAQFNKLLNRDLQTKVIVQDSLYQKPLPSYFSVLEDSVLLNSPTIEMLDAEADMYQAQHKNVKTEGLPMIGIGLDYMIFSPNDNDMGMEMGSNNMVMPMISLSLPIYRKKYKSMAKEIEIRQKALDYQKENIVNNLEVRWQETFRNLKREDRKITLYQEQTMLVEQALEITLASYAANSGAFEEVLDLHEQLLLYKTKKTDALALHNIALAQLEMLAATNLNIE